MNRYADELQLADLTKAPSSHVNTFSFSLHISHGENSVCSAREPSSNSTPKWQCLFSSAHMSRGQNYICEPSTADRTQCLFSTCKRRQKLCFLIAKTCALSPFTPLRDVGYVYARKRHTDCLFRLMQAGKSVQHCNMVSIFYSVTPTVPFFLESTSKRHSLVIKASMPDRTCLLRYAMYCILSLQVICIVVLV